MPLTYRIIFGDAQDMREIDDGTVHLVVTSPPYFNAPFDCPNLFPSYEGYLTIMRKVAQEIWRVLVPGRVACIVCDDVLRAKVGLENASLLDEAHFGVIIRSDARKLRTWLSDQVKGRDFSGAEKQTTKCQAQ